MKNKITILIIASIATLVALSGIQAYLIDNTYQLEKKLFVQETDEAISDIDNHPELDSLTDVIGDELKESLTDYKNKRISKAEVIQKLKMKADSVNPQYMKRYNAELDSIGLDYKIKYKRTITSIVTFDDKKTDSIYPYNATKNLIILGEEFDDEESQTVKTSRTFAEFEFVQQLNDSVFVNSIDLEIKTRDVIVIADWKSIVFRRMATLLIFSVLLFLFVVGLLYYSIKNLINQKKITEVKTDFINNITHELKTPLATLGVASKSLKNKEIQNTPEAFENTLHIVDRQNTRLQKLIDQVLTNSLSSEDIVLSKDNVIDTAYFTNLITDFKLSTQQKSLQLHTNLHQEDVVLRIDTFHFTTALLNILENAVKYGHDETEIHIKTQLKNNKYAIEISDNGPGISEKDQTQIFDKFYRVSHGNVHNVKGLGLGLYYTYQIVQAHEGKITVQSELNKGTSFTIIIPVN